MFCNDLENQEDSSSQELEKKMQSSLKILQRPGQKISLLKLINIHTQKPDFQIFWSAEVRTCLQQSVFKHLAQQKNTYIIFFQKTY